MNKTNCSGYETCRKYSTEEDLWCEDCDHYMPDDCFEDFEGKEPLFSKIRNWKEVE